MAQWDTDWAERWMRSQAKRSDVYGAATERMLDLADLCTGNRVLDVAAGTGEQTLLAASASWAEWLRVGHRHFDRQC